MERQVRQPKNPIRGWVILIIDDTFDNIFIAKKALEFYGAVVHTASSGAEGLALLDNIEPTVILLDIRMPDMDGWEVHQRIRQHPVHANRLVIAITAYAMDQDREQVLEAGFDGYIPKPFDLFGFAEAIEHLTREALAKR